MTYGELWKAIEAKRLKEAWSLDLAGWRSPSGETSFTWKLWLGTQERYINSNSPEELLAVLDAEPTTTTPESVGGPPTADAAVEPCPSPEEPAEDREVRVKCECCKCIVPAASIKRDVDRVPLCAECFTLPF